MSWLHPLEPVTFSALPERKRQGRPNVKIKYRGIRYPSIVECAAAHGWSISHMKKILSRNRKRKH